ncbi:hypothetical protein [Fischerella thermalis]|uniref:hypothetical protein n=1 Tax=Fischerella thermalis TaxID=372787 RepID=UPI0011AFBA97|nr:hypothetical protein [Fischerella thermalis]
MVVIAECDRTFLLPLLSLRPLRFKFFIKNHTILTTTWSFVQNLALWVIKKSDRYFPTSCR